MISLRLFRFSLFIVFLSVFSTSFTLGNSTDHKEKNPSKNSNESKGIKSNYLFIGAGGLGVFVLCCVFKRIHLGKHQDIVGIKDPIAPLSTKEPLRMDSNHNRNAPSPYELSLTCEQLIARLQELNTQEDILLAEAEKDPRNFQAPINNVDDSEFKQDDTPSTTTKYDHSRLTAKQITNWDEVKVEVDECSLAQGNPTKPKNKFLWLVNHCLLKLAGSFKIPDDSDSDDHFAGSLTTYTKLTKQAIDHFLFLVDQNQLKNNDLYDIIKEMYWYYAGRVRGFNFKERVLFIGQLYMVIKKHNLCSLLGITQKEALKQFYTSRFLKEKDILNNWEKEQKKDKLLSTQPKKMVRMGLNSTYKPNKIDQNLFEMQKKTLEDLNKLL